MSTSGSHCWVTAAPGEASQGVFERRSRATVKVAQARALHAAAGRAPSWTPPATE
eukprot:CAMPEP_0185622638 /NCGR_PEP_ID=MMETSP0436-20130131/59352_1 /TAXON_ID=626734 ORGANISM="Favella taraikaensis, Strain Fe Narragansett Bay" /NCGR_SAMPLE_ID=MMETSP0436 /ASSEMBLY_ACC=CAM_ASM_000390 /LENGTH=54 /DNA_ID=CAMNT_0028264427 /DNA_START=1883 /DNA_END=2047 /DNA_ORIENTATION=+